jgi:hypothetical protein
VTRDHADDRSRRPLLRLTGHRSAPEGDRWASVQLFARRLSPLTLHLEAMIRK